MNWNQSDQKGINNYTFKEAIAEFLYQKCKANSRQGSLHVLSVPHTSQAWEMKIPVASVIKKIIRFNVKS